LNLLNGLRLRCGLRLVDGLLRQLRADGRGLRRLLLRGDGLLRLRLRQLLHRLLLRRRTRVRTGAGERIVLAGLGEFGLVYAGGLRCGCEIVLLAGLRVQQHRLQRADRLGQAVVHRGLGATAGAARRGPAGSEALGDRLRHRLPRNDELVRVVPALLELRGLRRGRGRRLEPEHGLRGEPAARGGIEGRSCAESSGIRRGAGTVGATERSRSLLRSSVAGGCAEGCVTETRRRGGAIVSRTPLVSGTRPLRLRTRQLL
jgi:hypothetical protein